MEFLQNSCSVLRDRKRTQDPVAIAKWTHLNSSRTQKLSTFTATIVGLAPAKIASCRVLSYYRTRSYSSNNSSFLFYLEVISYH